MKKENVTDIEELIADAKAEEEVAREQEKAAKEQAFKDELREQLKEKLFTKRESAKVTIDLDEYVELKLKAADFDRILKAIVSSIELSYSKEYLRIKNDDNVIDTIKVLYPEAYDAIFEDLLAEDEGE